MSSLLVQNAYLTEMLKQAGLDAEAQAVAQRIQIVLTDEASALDAYRGIGALLRHFTGAEHQRASLGESPSIDPEFARRVTT